MTEQIQKILSREVKVKQEHTSPDVTLPGVRVFNDLQEGEATPEGTFQDPSVHTVVQNRITGSTSIARRRDEAPAVRDYIDPYTFTTSKVETINWDITWTYKGHVDTFTMLIPTQPYPTPNYTKESER